MISMKAYRLIIPGQPPTFKAGVIDYDGGAHIMPHPSTLAYRGSVREAIDTIYNDDFIFTSPVDVDIEFYFADRRERSVAGSAYVLMAALTPRLISRVGLVKRMSCDVLFDKENPRVELVIRPVVS